MARVVFTPQLERHLSCAPQTVSAQTVAEALRAVFAANPRVRGYLLDDQGGLRKHVAVFVDGTHVQDRTQLGDAVTSDSEIYVMQALSGG